MVESQIRKIKHIDRVSSLKNEIPGDAAEFWSHVSEYTIEDGTKPFYELSTYFLNLISLPVQARL